MIEKLNDRKCKKINDREKKKKKINQQFFLGG